LGPFNRSIPPETRGRDASGGVKAGPGLEQAGQATGGGTQKEKEERTREGALGKNIHWSERNAKKEEDGNKGKARK